MGLTGDPRVTGLIRPVQRPTAIPEFAPDGYDVLVLDAAFKQSLASVRSLGRAGLRVAVGECFAECDPSLPVAAFRSCHSSHNVVLPSYAVDASAFGAAVVEFVLQHPTRVVLPTMDGSIAALTPLREQLAALGCVLALAPNVALEVANDKDRTLEVARQLGVECPKTMRIDSLGELSALLAEFDFPFVVKPTTSWVRRSAVRLVPVEVVDESEAASVCQEFLTAGAGVLGQQWAGGRREGVTLFIVEGEVRASCAHATHRTTPALGGASVLRESIPIPQDIYDSSVRLVSAIGLDGVCEVEFRRDVNGHPLLMEINARLAGTIKNAVHSGVDFPLMTWQWATGQPVKSLHRYKTGVRTRWLRGDIRWLRDNYTRFGRPDSVSRTRAFWMFASEFARTRHYDSVNGRDLGPVIAEIQTMAAAARKPRRANGRLDNDELQGASHVT